MKIIPTNWVTRREVFTPVEDGPIIPTGAYSGRAKDKEMKVVRVHLTYRPGNGEWTTSSLGVIGVLIKQDGTPGQAEHLNSYSLENDDTPQWVRDIVEHFRPKEPAPTSPDSLEISA
ncbi:hypothetical protein [Streptomyces sp. NPDC002758]